MSQVLSQAEHISDFDFEVTYLVTWYKVINIECILSTSSCKSKIGNRNLPC